MAFRVLIVDDSRAMRSFIGRVLELSGFELSGRLEAGDGYEALKILETEWVDAILTDINMPNMNGEEFLRRLSEKHMTQSVPVVVVSTDGSEHRIEHMLALGARGYVRKPFAPETLRNELERVLEIAS